METEGDDKQLGSEASGSSGRPLLIGAIFAAGAGLGLGVKTLLDRRRKGAAGGRSPVQTSGGDTSDADLPTVLRRAALDVALAATTRAAERLDSGAGRELSADEHALEQRS